MSIRPVAALGVLIVLFQSFIKELITYFYFRNYLFHYTGLGGDLAISFLMDLFQILYEQKSYQRYIFADRCTVDVIFINLKEFITPVLEIAIIDLSLHQNFHQFVVVHRPHLILD